MASEGQNKLAAGYNFVRTDKNGQTCRIDHLHRRGLTPL